MKSWNGSVKVGFDRCFEGQNALVTGGASGMGRAQARMIAAEGARVGIFDINEVGGRETEDLIRSAGGEATFYHVDLTDVDRVEAALGQYTETYGTLDHLFNTAGSIIVKPYHETTEDEYDWLMDVNVKSAFIVTRRVVKQMAENGGGTIVMMASVASSCGFGLEAVYGVSKAAIHGMMINICAEYRDRNIRCNSVNPAFVRTPHGLGEIEKFKEQGVNWDDEALTTTQLRICEPEEVAAASLFLASPAASFVNGVAMNIDAGWMSAA